MSTTRTFDAASFLQQFFAWDAHSCLPLHPDADIRVLERHREVGFDFVSINVGMDLNPVAQVMAVLASFRAQLLANPERFVLAGTAGDVDAARRSGRLAVAFDLEGALPFQGRPEAVAAFAALGVRMIHLAYNRNNEAGGGCYDADVPLTELGRRYVAAINDAGVIMDCSHTGHRTSLDVMEASVHPAVFSHSNPRALCDDPRNVTDEQIRACVATGGVVCANGIGRFLGEADAPSSAIVRHVDHLVAKAGIDHVGIGVDYCYPANGLDENPPGLDKAYWWPPEQGYDGLTNVRMAVPEQTIEVVEGLMRLGYADEALAKILGGNMRRVAERVWPAGPREG